LLAFVGALSSAAVFACTPLKPRDDSPIGEGFADRDAAVLSLAGSAPSWACLASMERRETLIRPADDGQRWVYSVRALNLLSGQVIPELSVRACRATDVNCQDPLGEARLADQDGWVDVPVNEGFTGYFEFTAPTIVPEMIFYSRLLPSNRGLRNPHGMLERDALAALAGALGTTQSPGAGVLAMRLYDCNGSPAEGVEISQDRGGQPWYFVDGLPSRDATATTAQGLGGFANVPPGIAVLSAKLEDGMSLGPGQSVLVRAGWLTTLAFDPSGRPD
jgi:hypothetical protein